MAEDMYHGDEAHAGDPLYALRHSTAHVMAYAVRELFPEARFAIGPPIKDGFYYDMELPRALTDEDLTRIEEKMREIVKANLPFVREMWPAPKAAEFFAARGQNYKVELIRDIGEPDMSIYTVGEFVDLCNGPHVRYSKQCKHFKLLSVAGAYWRGSEKNAQLQRIYGTVWETKEDLDRHLHMLEEARRRDHRKLGRELDLFSIQHDEAGAGFVFWHPRGTVVRQCVEDYSRGVHLRRGYQYVTTPHIFRHNLWRTSGHYDWYRENMYGLEIDEDEYVVKPMNCPGHTLIYRNHLRSYRDLPLRYAELGTVYRYERSGALHGLLRVRGFTQDDAHIFCTPEQVEDEVVGVLEVMQEILGAFGFTEYRVELSARDPNRPHDYAGTTPEWELAETTLARAAERKGLAYTRKEGEAVFYGPKLDAKLVDALGREWQASTVQFDFNLPRRFGLTYAGADGREHQPMMVHRAIFGSVERFLGLLIEHYAGAFPAWLAPEQARVLSISEKAEDWAKSVAARLSGAGLRAVADVTNEKIGAKIRLAETQKVPYILVVGEKERDAGTVAVRIHGRGDQGAQSLDAAIERILSNAASRSLHPD